MGGEGKESGEENVTRPRGGRSVEDGDDRKRGRLGGAGRKGGGRWVTGRPGWDWKREENRGQGGSFENY